MRIFFRRCASPTNLVSGCAWVAETHLSCQVQKTNPQAVIPHFKGEIGLNTDILQLAHKIFAITRKINVGSAIRNILCNGGPIAHAEAVRMFLSLHGLEKNESRCLELGFASGRFPFSNRPYGILPRNPLEAKAWPVMKGLVFKEAIEIFLRFIRGDVFSSEDVTKKELSPQMFRSQDEWESVAKLWQEAQLSSGGTSSGVASAVDKIPIAPFWNFERVGVIPFEAPLQFLKLTIGAHDAETQTFANRFLPVGVFNLSITPGSIIDETHQRMSADYNSSGGRWHRGLMPRTVLVFIDENSDRARQSAGKALENYWSAIEGTLDTKKVEQAVTNALVGNPSEIRDQLRERFHPDDRLMLWFDFNNHDNQAVQKSMSLFMENVAAEFLQPLQEW